MDRRAGAAGAVGAEGVGAGLRDAPAAGLRPPAGRGHPTPVAGLSDDGGGKGDQGAELTGGSTDGELLLRDICS
jgi:hypothetical protein